MSPTTDPRHPADTASELERRRALIAQARKLADQSDIGTSPAVERESLSPLRLRCPACHEPVELEPHASWSGIKCVSCRQEFNLVDDVIESVPGGGRLGPFQLIERIGTGGFGVVWKARDTRLDRLVAIKVPRREAREPGDAENFLREARAASQLQHPYIVGIHEVGRQENTVYMVCDLVEGSTLEQWLETHHFSLRGAATFVHQLALAIEHAHSHDIVHRDLKPANILVSEGGVYDSPGHDGNLPVPHITDFGLAKQFAGEMTVTMDGQVMGTPAYMSPEQARGDSHSVDGRADIYSLGVLLFELLTHELPFRGDAATILRQLMHDDPPSPRSLNARIPRDLDTICTKCLQTDPSQRYSTAQLLADDLHRFLRGDAVLARPIGAFRKVTRWCRRNAALAALAVLTALIAIISPIVAIRQAVLVQRESQAKQAAHEWSQRTTELAYTFGMASVQQAVRELNFPRANQILHRFLPQEKAEDARSFPWYYWWHVTHASLREQQRLPARPQSVAVSRDGTTLVCGGIPGGFVIQSVSSGELRKVSVDGLAIGQTLAISPDSKVIAVAGRGERPDDFGIRLCQASDGRVIQILDGHDAIVHHVSFSPDGSELASASCDKTIRRWSIPAGDLLQVLPGHGRCAQCLVYTPDGSRLISGGDSGMGTAEKIEGEIITWDLSTGQPVAQISCVPGLVRKLVMTRGGSNVISCGMDGAPQILDANTLELDRELESIPGITYAVATDATHIFGANERGPIWCWRTDNGRLVTRLAGHEDVINDLAMHPNSPTLYSVGSDFTLCTWNVSSHALATNRGDPNVMAHVEYPQGILPSIAWDRSRPILLVSTQQGFAQITVKSPDDLEIRHVATAPVMDFQSAADRIVTRQYDPDLNVTQLRILSLATNQERSVDLPEGMITACARLASAGDTLAVGTGGLTNSFDTPVDILLYHAGTGELLRRLHHHHRAITALAFSPDGKRLAVAGGDRSLAIWNVPSGELVRSFEDFFNQSMGILIDLRFHPDGKLLVGCNRLGELWWWDLTTGQSEVRVQRGTQAFCFDISPDGRVVAVGGELVDKPVRGTSRSEIAIWDVATRELASVLPLEHGAIRQLAFSPTGMKMAAYTSDGEVLVWTAASEKQVIRSLQERGQSPWNDAHPTLP